MNETLNEPEIEEMSAAEKIHSLEDKVEDLQNQVGNLTSLLKQSLDDIEQFKIDRQQLQRTHILPEDSETSENTY